MAMATGDAPAGGPGAADAASPQAGPAPAATSTATAASDVRQRRRAAPDANILPPVASRLDNVGTAARGAAPAAGSADPPPSRVAWIAGDSESARQASG